MSEASILRRENELLRERLSKLSEASLRINESLDFDTVLQVVLENACSLTGACYGLITLLDDAGRIQDLVTTGPERGGNTEGCWSCPRGGSSSSTWST